MTYFRMSSPPVGHHHAAGSHRIAASGCLWQMLHVDTLLQRAGHSFSRLMTIRLPSKEIASAILGSFEW